MCGRYTVEDPDAIGSRFKASKPMNGTVKPNYNAAPGQILPVITSQDGRRAIKLMKWGLIPSWAKDANIGYKMINARSETIFEKNSWRLAIKSRRCLIPANAFYEWRRENGNKKQPYYIHLSNDEMFAFAGIWEMWTDQDGKEVNSYSIITTTPNEEMKSIHDRMPVILHHQDEADWLEAKRDDRGYLQDLMVPLEDGALAMHQASTDVNSVKNNDDKLILPLNSK